MLTTHVFVGSTCVDCCTAEGIYKVCVCSKWGYNRIVEQHATGPISLVLPVLTRPDVVQQAVDGIHSGQINLSLLNMEALLVLANAVGVSQMALCI